MPKTKMASDEMKHKKLIGIVCCLVFIMAFSSCVSYPSISETSLDAQHSILHAVEPTEEIPVYWNYYISPEAARTGTASIIVNAGGGQIERSVEAAQQSTRREVEYIMSGIRSEPYVLLAPALPLRPEGFDGDAWTLHFPADVFRRMTSRTYFRPDLQVVEMISVLSETLRDAGMSIDQKVLPFGYSIGGHFANRFSMLHPSLVRAYAAGGISGELTLPVSEIDGDSLKWPQGVANFEELTGAEFDEAAYQQISAFIFWGSEDRHPYHLGEKREYGGEGYGQRYYDRWIDRWGDDSVEALRSQSQFYSDLGYQVSIHEMEGVGHRFTNEQWDLMMDFFRDTK